ncbi:ribosome recycling factor [Desulfobotulus mexicanus]|uniref:Ribosome-recycling factor n=1 Tax=Desulfobotulus mexicanus TaxID=2586642 RepID=A0A5Q4VDN7_9BACT|nr:ribosome recycling factor [Desulfobotulus mexicanus]TYT75745.1 ribosome recycling factor [Desulfobotulus mexicanus]
MLDTVYSETQEKMARAIDGLKAELLKVRTGRASANMLDSVRVDYYGTLTPLHQMASISTPESRLLVIQPWDATAMKEIEKGILKANVGLTPSNDGKVIRISIPPLTEERRKDIVKQVGKTCEEYKVGVRNLRRDANESLKAFKKDGDISEDELFKGQDQIQKLTDDYIRQIEDLQKVKEKEVLEF